MGYLNQKEITVDAVLTKVGRELLANNKPLNIKRFALSDDEVDYTLWNQTHPMGSDYYGQAIQNLPILEPVVSTDASMLNLLYTPGTDAVITVTPEISIGVESITLKGSAGTSYKFTPSTTAGSNSSGYIVELADNTYCNLYAYTQKNAIYGYTGYDTSTTKRKTGYSFVLVSKSAPVNASTTMVIKGVNVGTSIGITISIPKNYDPTLPPAGWAGYSEDGSSLID